MTELPSKGNGISGSNTIQRRIFLPIKIDKIDKINKIEKSNKIDRNRLPIYIGRI